MMLRQSHYHQCLCCIRFSKEIIIFASNPLIQKLLPWKIRLGKQNTLETYFHTEFVLPYNFMIEEEFGLAFHQM